MLKEIRENLKNGGGLHTSCKAAGIAVTTLWGWRKKWRKVDNYINRILESRVQLVEDALYKAAITGNITAQIFFLKNRGKGWCDTPLVDQSRHTHRTLVWRLHNGNGTTRDVSVRTPSESKSDIPGQDKV